MKPFRATIAGFLGMIAILSVGLMGLREGTAPWAMLMFGLTLSILAGATLTALVHPRGERPGWTGFSLLGWIYLILHFGNLTDSSLPRSPQMPTAWLAYDLIGWIHPTAPRIDFVSRSGRDTRTAWLRAQIYADEHVKQTAHSLAALLIGAIGAVWARWIARRAGTLPT